MKFFNLKLKNLSGNILFTLHSTTSYKRGFDYAFDVYWRTRSRINSLCLSYVYVFFFIPSKKRAIRIISIKSRETTHLHERKEKIYRKRFKFCTVTPTDENINWKKKIKIGICPSYPIHKSDDDVFIVQKKTQNFG